MARKIPSDQEILKNTIMLLTGIEKVYKNPNLFNGIHDREREAMLLSMKRSVTCAKNIARTLGIQTQL